MQLLNTLYPKVVTEDGIFIFAKFLQPEKAPVPSSVRVDGRTTSVIPVQFAKALAEILVTPSGITNFPVKPIQLLNAFSPIVNLLV